MKISREDEEHYFVKHIITFIRRLTDVRRVLQPYVHLHDGCISKKPWSLFGTSIGSGFRTLI